MSDKKSLATILIAITITISVGVAAGAVYVNYNNDMQKLSQANQTNVNTTGINGNVTSITELDNGTLLVSVISEPSESKEMKYQNNVVKSILSDAKQFSNVCTVQITTKDDNESRVVYEKPNSIACKFIEKEPPINETVVTPQAAAPNQTQQPTMAAAVNNTIPPAPEPTNVTQDMKVIMVGDISDSTSGKSVFNQIKKQNATNVIILGDLGYKSNLDWFKSTYGTLGNKVNCVIGNHEADNEDGGSTIEKQAKQYCTDTYYIKKNNVLFLAFNTNGDLSAQATSAGKLLQSSSFMKGIKSVHIVSHKPCAVPPNSHHNVEVKSFCDAIKAKIPTTVKAYYDQAHNHVLSSSTDGTYKQSGAGGKSHYTCGTSTTFNWCNNSNYGFLMYNIKPDGTTTSQFIDYNGKVLH